MEGLLVIFGILGFLYGTVVVLDWWTKRTGGYSNKFSSEESNFSVFIKLLKLYGWIFVVGLILSALTGGIL